MLRILCFLLIAPTIMGLELKSQLKDHWQNFKKVHLKSYVPAEESRRKEIFKQNVEAILQHNLKADLGEETFKMGINKFADMTEEEIVQNYMGLAPSPAEERTEENVDCNHHLDSREDYPETVDWRESGFLSEPKDQSHCGSCWAFAATGVVEAHYGLATKRKVVLSEQMLLDCAFNGGCKKGGNVLGGFYYIQGRGIQDADCYPYVAEKSETCKYNRDCVVANITSHKTIKKGNEDDLLRVVATKGPVAVTMYAHPRQLSLYRGGVYNPETCTETANHAVVVVGYGTEDGQPYWLIRNSWGPKWAGDGHFKLARNAGNKCWVASDGRYPVI